MATTLATPRSAKGGSFLLESPAPADVFTPADLSDDQRLIGQSAEEFVLKEVFPHIKDLEAKKPGLLPELVKKAGELGLLSGGIPEAVRRRGARQSRDHGADGKAFHLWRLCCDPRRTRGHRHAADRVFRDRRAEEKISAEAGHRRMDRRVLPVASRRPAPTRKIR